MFPYVYRLRTDDDDNNKLYLDTEKARSKEKKTFILERIFEDDYFTTHHIISIQDYHYSTTQDTVNLPDKIKAILDKHTEPCISFDLLRKELGGTVSDGGIKNSLKKLADEGLIAKTDRKWNKITIIGKSSSVPEEKEKYNDEGIEA